MQENEFIEEKLPYKAVIWGRISRKNENINNQIANLRDSLEKKSIPVDKIYTEGNTGWVEMAERPKFLEFLNEMDKTEPRQVWAVAADRLTRNGGFELIGIVRRLQKHGHTVHTFKEGRLISLKDPQGIDQDKELLSYIYGYMAQMESGNTSRRKLLANKLFRLHGESGKLGGNKNRDIPPEIIKEILAYRQVHTREETVKEFQPRLGTVIKKVKKEDGTEQEVDTGKPVFTTMVLRRLEGDLQIKKPDLQAV